MERFFVIETDTDSSNVFVYEVERTFTSTVNYQRECGGKSAVMGKPTPKFYGKLDALLITADKLENAAPIEIEAPAEKVTA